MLFKEINTAYDVLRLYDDGPSRLHEPRTKHTGLKHGASGTEQSGTQGQRSRTKKNHGARLSAEQTESQKSRNRRSRPWNRWSALARDGIERVQEAIDTTTPAGKRQAASSRFTSLPHSPSSRTPVRVPHGRRLLRLHVRNFPDRSLLNHFHGNHLR